MTKYENINRAYDTIQNHPYVDESGMSILKFMVGEHFFGSMVEFQKGVLKDHATEPVDIIVGDDVSGRVLTLVTHRFLRIALERGEVDKVPATVFMASGLMDEKAATSVGFNEVNSLWSTNSFEHAGKILGKISANRVMIITEMVSTGSSVERLEEAFGSHNMDTCYRVPAKGARLYMNDRGSDNRNRLVVGVEKQAPNPNTHRIDGFDGKKSSQLRRFLDDYTADLYAAAFPDSSSADSIDLTLAKVV